ncbi:ubiquitin-conjugating enzyme E2 S [Galendromus occidentalis]|uniref:E2 ubiquitin-conjugating enzyme n=1 Tax=Galendromus occidentalis TaxID=34638 RepID=A0AAJ6QWP1_9ACAR|nr:ubiquitin-conjugating enzyme E2 S [Galendromus occidentalis]
MRISTSNVENLAPQVIRAVRKELMDLTRSPPEGLKLHLNDADVTDIQATLEGPQGTPFSGGEFRLRLVLSKDHPCTPPKGYFLTRIFHPNVAPDSGQICVNTLKKDWTPDTGLLRIFLTIKCLLIVPNAESALNEEAGRLLLDHYTEYEKRAKMMTAIHAQPTQKSEHPEPTACDTSQATTSKRFHSTVTPLVASNSNADVSKKQMKVLKEKKRALKRL